MASIISAAILKQDRRFNGKRFKPIEVIEPTELDVETLSSKLTYDVVGYLDGDDINGQVYGTFKDRALAEREASKLDSTYRLYPVRFVVEPWLND